MSDLDTFLSYLRAGHPCIRIVTHEEIDALRLVRDAAMELGQGMLQWSAVHGIRDGLIAGSGAVKDTEHPAAALFYFSQLGEPKVCVTQDVADHLGDARTLRALRDAIARCEQIGGHLVLIDHQDSTPAVVKACSTRLELSLPGEAELEELVRATVRRLHVRSPIEIKLTKREFAAIIKNLLGLTRRQAEQVISDVVSSDHRFDAEDLNRVIAEKRQILSGGGLLTYVETPLDLRAVGGLRRLKAWLKQREGAMDADAREAGLEPPRGVLMLGVQGAGKSLCAKAIATAWSRPLLRMDPGALYDRYIGESERRLRDALHQAESMAPVVLWIDEIEKGFASAASQSTDGGLSKRMFGDLLTWMQEHVAPVFLIATANDIEALPPELLRKGRFDEIFFVDLPRAEARRAIFAIHLRKRKQDPQAFDLPTLVAASEGYSGAEIEAAIISALHTAYAEKQKLDTARVERALRESPPLSVTMREKVQALRAWAKGRCVPAD